MKNLYNAVAAMIVVLLCSTVSEAANHYVRSGASGNGSDWANACGDFTGSCAVSSLVRGDTYYVAGGKYAARVWDRATSGSSVITIKKATVADHGTSVGWANAYGDVQAVWTGANNILTGYWTFDGQVGDHDTGVAYGFKADFSQGDTGIKVNAPGHSNWVFRYVDFDGITQTGNFNYTANTKGFEVWSGDTWTLSHCSIHGGESLIQAGGANALVEYSYLYNQRSIADQWHGNVFFTSGSTNGVFRFNKVWDFNAEGLFFTGWSGSPSGWKVYGNAFSGTGSEVNPRGIELRQDYSYFGMEFYNNTCSNLGVGCILNRSPETGHTCSNCTARNNLSYLAPNKLAGMTASNNTEDNVDRFVSVAARNFRLKAALPGESLASAYAIDLDGKTRGADGTWDRGAYEVGGTTAPPPPPPPPPPTSKFTIGQTVQTTAAVNVRATPAGALIGTQLSGAIGSVVSGPVSTTFNGFNVIWWNLNFVLGVDGQVGEDNLAASGTPPPSVTPAPPSNVAAVPSSMTIQLSWTAGPVGSAGYNIYRSTGVDGVYVKINPALVKVANYSDTVVYAPSYYYAISLVSGWGVESAQSTPVKVSP